MRWTWYMLNFFSTLSPKLRVGINALAKVNVRYL